MGLLAAINAHDSPFLPYLNTGTMFDLITGAFVPAVDNRYVLNGGLAATNGVMAKPQQYKSSLALGLVMNVMARFAEAEALGFDSENSLNKQRVLSFANLYHDEPEKRAALLAELDERTAITNIHEHDLETFMEKVKELAAKKLADRKALEREIPLLDPRTGKPQRMLVPTFVFIDSWSFAKVKSAMEMLDKHAASSSDTNTLFMREGLAKKKILGLIPSLAVRAGIYFFVVAHVGVKTDMSGGYGPPPKDMQYMRQGESAKGVGADFMFLLSNLIELRTAKVLLDNDKECQYPLPTGLTAPTEMSTVTAITTRCKNNNAGTQFEPVMSQTRGMETALTNYHYLREHDYFGLDGNKVNHQPLLWPEAKLTRKNAAAKLADYKTARAIELLAQLCYVQNSWTIRDDTAVFRMTPQELTDALVKRSGYAMDDILNSRGWWTYDRHERPYLSLLDVLDIAAGTYKPKLHAVASAAKST